ncbi:MAG: hypothetical protein KBS52_05625 [Clostridiales bacterium]|nr:hypothetical protein [Candidatus Equinaster intestinalis]
MKEIIAELLEKIEQINKKPDSALALPDNTYFIDENRILCKTRKRGFSRYPYSCDGFSLWATDGGYITTTESNYTVFRNCFMDEAPCTGFFMGLKQKDGSFFPISSTLSGAQLFEPLKVERYTVFTPAAAYYIADSKDFTFATRIFVSKSKKMNFSLTAINKTKKPLDIYLAAYFEALLRFSEAESHWEASSRVSRRFKNGNFIITNTHEVFSSLTVNTRAAAGEITYRDFATCYNDYIVQKGRGYSNSAALKLGEFPRKTEVSKDANKFPLAADMAHFTVNPGDYAQMDYCLGLEYDEAKAFATAKKSKLPDGNWNNAVARLEKAADNLLKPISIDFTDWKIGKNDPKVLNLFLKSVERQVNFCATGNSYAGSYLGVRDVFQQLEAAVLWDRSTARKCIARAFNYIDESGRPPRQFAISSSEKLLPAMDLREFVDQGLWMVDTVYTYLAYTGDYSILEEKCRYYKFPEGVVYGRVLASNKKDDTLLEHLLCIMDFLISNLDTENTYCLKVLFGDWNDALDGLGKTKKPGQKYGNGVTVMGTLQFYRNLNEMCEILNAVGGFEKTIKKYKEIKEKVCAGFFKNAVAENKKGEKRIVHGWGDDREYYIGSFRDPDGADRISFAPNAFYAISGIINEDDSLKQTAIDTLLALKSKYGLKTLTPAFEPALQPFVGRIAHTTRGCAENDCAYVHASMFSIMALFMMGKSEEAWRELERSIVISHESPSLTPFVMPNSFLHNEELGLDGESAGDWYTGSGTVLIKGLVKYGFGIRPTLDKLYIELPKFMPTSKVTVKLRIKDTNLTLTYENKNEDTRQYFVNGKAAKTEINGISETPRLIFDAKELPKNLNIKITD